MFNDMFDEDEEFLDDAEGGKTSYAPTSSLKPPAESTELFGHVDYGHKNQHGAYSRDESLKDSYYWTNQETPWYEGGRVVVGFSYGYVLSNFADLRAFARAVRVAGQ